MTGQEFMLRFGASCRMKNLDALELKKKRQPKPWRHRVRPNPRPYPVPSASGLPADLIRVDPWEADYLFLIASLARTGIVEIGRFKGGTTFMFACANPDIPIWSIDINPLGDDELLQHFETHEIGSNVNLLTGDSQGGSFTEIGAFDLLFVDGDHSYKGCLGDLNNFFPRLEPGGHVLFHDCSGGRPVQRAVLDFMQDTNVEVVRSPYIPAVHWHTDYGSIAHLKKPAR
jgi:predicted O-methyltransferase YrrM